MPWRGILPLIHIALYTALVWWGYQQRCEPQRAEAEGRFVAVQETSGVPFNPVYDVPPPLGYRLAMAINLPAFLPIGIAALLFPRVANVFEPCQQDLLLLGISGMCVYALWLLIGWRIDRRKERAAQPTRLRWLWISALLVCGAIAFFCLVASVGALIGGDATALR